MCCDANEAVGRVNKILVNVLLPIPPYVDGKKAAQGGESSITEEEEEMTQIAFSFQLSAFSSVVMASRPALTSGAVGRTAR